MHKDDLLIEILTEELPPKSLLPLASSFHDHLISSLQKAELTFVSSDYYVTPRRLAVVVRQLDSEQPNQVIERKGPALKAAFDETGHPTKACVGFARSCGIQPESLITLKQGQQEWVGFKELRQGHAVEMLLPPLIQAAIDALPIAKRMRWGGSATEFVRPVHAVTLLFGERVIEGTILNCVTGRETFGHRFLNPHPISIQHAATYVEQLRNEGFVMASFAERKARIIELSNKVVHKQGGSQAKALLDNEALLNEVTGLVEWPTAFCGHFDAEFLQLPKEVLMTSMQDHQRYFPIVNEANAILPYFLAISNVASSDLSEVIKGNERVLRARLQDAAFFYQADQKESLAARQERLKQIVFQAKLGTLSDKVERLSDLSAFIANELDRPPEVVTRAAALSKSDLTTNMVNEFPTLQGVMGFYYAKACEPVEVAQALREHYLPRFAQDDLPLSVDGQILALADRIDSLIGTFGVSQIPTGDKDPFGLRRAALGVVRILIEKHLHLDLTKVFDYAASLYHNKLTNQAVVNELRQFIEDRLRSYCLDQGIALDVFTAVNALKLSDPYDTYLRMEAVQAFKLSERGVALSIANKRVSNILAKYAAAFQSDVINPRYFAQEAEAHLAAHLQSQRNQITELSKDRRYHDVLLLLSDLREVVDDFFDQVMVMDEDPLKRENRLLMLKELRVLFLNVADIALLA